MSNYGKQKKLELLSASDIFDIYMCEFLLNKLPAGADGTESLKLRVDEIHKKYKAVARLRIIKEAKYLGIDIDDDGFLSFSIEKLVGSIGKALENEMLEAAEDMQRGAGFNLMGSLLKNAQQGGMDMQGIDLSKFGVAKEEAKPKETTLDADMFNGGERGNRGGGGLVRDPKWHIIAKAFVDLEQADDTNSKIQAIDVINDLQHNSFHILIDLQTGRMLHGNEYTGAVSHQQAVENLHEVLDIKKNARTPLDFISKVSSDLRKIYNQNKALV